MTLLIGSIKDNRMAAGRFRLKGRPILKLGKGVDNPHQVHLRSQVSWPTITKYLSGEETTLEDMRSVDLGVLYSLLVDGLGLSEAEALDLRLSDILEVSRKGAE